MTSFTIRFNEHHPLSALRGNTVTVERFEAVDKHAAIEVYRAKRSAANKRTQVTLYGPRGAKCAEAFGTAACPQPARRARDERRAEQFV